MGNSILHHQIGRDQYYKIWHTIGENMLIYIHQGSGSIVCSERAYPMEKGTLCFIGAGKYHYTMPDNPLDYDRSKVFLSGEELHRLFALLPEKNRFSRSYTADAFVRSQIPPEQQAIVEALFEEIAAAPEAYREAVLYSSYLRLLTLLDQYIPEQLSPSSDTMQLAIEYINRHIFENLSIDTICSAVHTSKYHFCRQFKKATGFTVMEYILKTRLILAKDMLLKDDRTISEISEACGFSSVSYFSRVFRQEMGMAPLKYRTSHKT